MVIDFHTHIFPEKIAAKTIQVLKAGIRRQQGVDFPAYTDATERGLRESMEKNGIDISVVVPIATKPTQSDTINSYARSVSHDGLISFGSVHPDQEDALQVLEHLKEAGVQGIKLHPEFQSFYIDSEKSLAILRKAEELGLLVTLHAGADVGMPPPIHCTPQMLCNVLDKVSGDNIIAAHMGGFWLWEDVLRLLAGSPLYFDTAVVGQFIDKDIYKELIRAHGAHKVLFASDSPWEDQGEALSTLCSLGLTEEELERVTYRNACELLKLPVVK